MRIGAFTKFELELSSAATVEAGVRYEHYDRDVESGGVTGSKNDGKILPAVHLRWDLTSDDRIRASAARTIRFPDFDLVSPFEEDETPGDDDILTGNPDLDVETAWGFDLGYERRIGSRGVAGLNVFYRDFQDLIELVPVAPNGAGAFFIPMNVGDGKAWGVEFDLSTPLDMFGLPDTAFYANAAYLDSEVMDFNTGLERKFTNQPDFVYNLSLIQNFPDCGFAFGGSYQKRGASLEFGFDEIVETSYEGNLELFAEQRFGERAVLRFSAANLLDSHKLEFIEAYDGDNAMEFADAIRAGDVDGIEIQDEQSSRVFSLTLRLSL
jgi:outer membrane receptor protein involved in Fe transport